MFVDDSKGLDYWRKQFKNKTQISKKLLISWKSKKTRKEIAAEFNTSIGALCGLRDEGYLERRIPGPKNKIKEDILDKKPRKTKEELLAEAISRKIDQTHSIPGLPKIIKTPKIKHITTQHKDETQVVLLSDCHPGIKTKSFNSSIFVNRMTNFTKGILKINSLHRKLYPIRNLHVFVLGDLVNGERIGKTVNADEFECSVDEQIFKWFSPTMVEFLSTMANNFENVYVDVVKGNHGSPVGRDSAYSTNWDVISMRHISALLNDIKNIHIDIEAESNYKIAEVKGHYFFLTHGDGIPIHLTIPFYGMTTRALRLRSIESFKSELVSNIIDGFSSGKYDKNQVLRMLTSAPFSYFCCGHFHTVNRFDFNNIEFLTNGTFKSDDQYAIQRMGMGNSPCQVTFGVSAKRGITWHYKIQVDR